MHNTGKVGYKHEYFNLREESLNLIKSITEEVDILAATVDKYITSSDMYAQYRKGRL